MGVSEFSRLFSRNLNNALIERGKTQTDLCKALNFSKSTVSSWCNGTRVPRPDAMDEICNYLNIRRSDLMEIQPRDYIFTAKDYELIVEYRMADEVTRQSIDRLLEYARLKREKEGR